MNVLVFDWETSYKFPDAWNPDSFPVSLGLLSGTTYVDYIFNHQQVAPTANLKDIQQWFDWADMIVAHNIKFDLHWLRKVGIKLKPTIKLYDTMIVEYLLKGQSTVGELSLEDLSKIYLEEEKDDKVKMYWDAGYDTDEIPVSILMPYMKRDILNTFELYQLQQEEIKNKGMDKLVRLQCELAGVVEEMEWNGMKVNIPLCKKMDEDCTIKMQELNHELEYFVVDNLPELRDIPIKWSSGDHLSAILFGGIIVYDGVEETERVLKDGTIKRGTRKAKLEIKTDGMGFTPAKKTETKKKGYYQTDKAQLEQLKAKTPQQRRFLEISRELSSAEKMSSTYFKPFQLESIGDIFHARFNQCATVTGRLTCSRLHQIPRSDDAGVKQVFVTSYKSNEGGEMSQRQAGST